MAGSNKKCASVSITILSVFLILGPSLFFGFLGKATEMGFALAAGVLAAAFINLEKLQKFKGAGIEIELKQAVKEAQATIDNLKEFTDPLFISSIKIFSEGLSWGGIPDNIQHDIVHKIEKIAKENKASTDVMQTIEAFYNRNLGNAYKRIYDEVIRYRQEKTEHKFWGLMDETAGVFPSEKQIREVLSELPDISSELDELIKDYLYYKANCYPRSR